MKVCGNCHKIRLSYGNGKDALGNYLYCNDTDEMVAWEQKKCGSTDEWNGYEPQIGINNKTGWISDKIIRLMYVILFIGLMFEIINKYCK